MRIIGGKYRSRVLSDFAGEDVRPTSDRAREALLNILYPKVIGARVLDLFSGSGAVGIECLSRGAKEVVFNDCAKESLAILRKNLKTLKIAENGEEAKVYAYDYAVCLNGLKGCFDIIFLDPPYRMDAAEKAFSLILQNRLLAKGGVVVYERDKALDGAINGFVKTDERKYGKAYFSFFRYAKDGEE